MGSSRKRRFGFTSRELDLLPSAEQKHNGQRIRFLRATFSINDSVFQEWPGITAFLQHMEHQLAQASQPIIDPFLQQLVRESGATSAPNVHELLASIAVLFTESKDDDVSLMELLELLLTKYGIAKRRGDSDDVGRRVLFSALCWLTCLLNPSQEVSDTLGICIPSKQSGLRARQRMDNANRPIAGFLRGFGNILPQLDVKVDQQSELLHASVVNFYSLNTVGKITVQWVDTLSAHMDFHALSRTLMLYRFPTMCALHCLGDEESHCANRILRSYYPACANSTIALTAWRREILLSYRLIFGQNYRARRLYHTRERKAAGNGVYDSFLDKLCGESFSKSLKNLPCELWPESCLDEESSLQEQDAYSVETDFPLLGPRILKLQAFNLRQSPTRISDLWRDRRNPLQWYTFWAVLVIGSISLFLTFIQTLAAIAQVVVAIT